MPVLFHNGSTSLSSSLSNLADILTEGIHKIMILEYESSIDNLQNINVYLE